MDLQHSNEKEAQIPKALKKNLLSIRIFIINYSYQTKIMYL